MSIPEGLTEAADLILDWCGGALSEDGVTTHKNPLTPTKASPITLTISKLNGLSGCDISLTEAKKFLEALGFTTVSSNSTDLTVVAPTYRPDIEGPADLVEEVMRLNGYDKIPAAALPPPPLQMEAQSIPSIVKHILASRGLNEAITWSFMDEDLAAKFGGKDPSLRLANPISVEMGFMRPSIIPNLIQAAIRNHDRGQGSVSLFEVGPQFDKGAQTLMATGLLAGQTGPRHWAQPSRPVDVFDVKAHVLAVLATLGIAESSVQLDATGPDYYHPGRKGTFKQGNKVIAHFGEIHPAILDDLKGEGAFAGFEVFLDHLPPLKMKKSTLHLSPYQPVTRDFAFVVGDATPADDVIKAIAKVDRDLITNIHIFDVYKGEKLEKNQKSLAIQVRLEPQSGTLTDAQIMEVCDKIVANVSKATGGVLRKS
jgi:phenylalanyl-tRNA synthetase beta chain